MKFKTREVVRGFQNASYDIDGKTVQTKVVFIDAAMNEDSGGKGYRSVEKKCVSADVIREVEHCPFPGEFELEIEELATKNKAELFVFSMRPIKPVGAPPGASLGVPPGAK